MADEQRYRKSLKKLLSSVEKIMRFRHHIIFISTYLKMNNVPKGFRLRFHNNIADCNYDSVLRNCSKKLMLKTVNSYKKKLVAVQKESESLLKEARDQFPEKTDRIEVLKQQKVENLQNILSNRRDKKYARDGLDMQQAKQHSMNLGDNLQNGFQGDRHRNELRDRIMSNVVIPSHAPINLDSQSRDLPAGISDLCSKGPSFIPTPISYDWLQLQKDFDRFRNTMRARVYFSDKQDKVTPIDPLGAPPKTSTWTAPKCKAPEVEVFLSAVERDLFSNTVRKRVTDNLTKDERSALNKWRSENLFDSESDLVMRLQDKGNRFIIVDKTTDKQKAQEQIDRSSFVEIDHDPTQEHIACVTEWAEKWYNKGQISKDWKAYIINENAQPGKNSTLYKTHKEDIPVRLLTAGSNTAIENLSRFCEKACAPLTIGMPGKINDTAHLLHIIDRINEQGLPDNAALVSLDIVNMFPNIDNEKGLKSLKKALDSRTVKKPSTACVIEGLGICLYKNNSSFGNKHLLQTNGTATGAPNSCSYSDLALQPIDELIFQKKEETYNELEYFGRYRDDCLIIWTGSKSQLDEFQVFINSLDEKLQFKMSPMGDSICFLDLKLSIMGNQIFTTVYSKPTDSHLYLLASSCHNASLVNGIQKGVALRLRRLCSTDDDYDEKAKLYMAYLVARGHDPLIVEKTFKEIRAISRNAARKKKVKESTGQKVFLSTKYNPRGPDVKAIVNKHLKIITDHPTLNNLFPQKSIIVAYKRENNLKDLLLRADPYNIKSDLLDSTPHGFKRCSSNKCDSCDNFVIETDQIKCQATGKIFKIRMDITCSTPNVIYCAFCLKCDKSQGVGSTIKWKSRLSNYKSHIKNKINTCKIVNHFITNCRDENNPTGNLKFILIDALNNVDGITNEQVEDLLLKKEQFWIGTLITQHQGLNDTHDWKRKTRCERPKLL